MSTGHQEQIQGRDVHIDDIEWKDHPQPFAEGGIRWKLLNVSPEMGSWTAIYDCPKGSYFAPHIHIGPGEYFLTKGKMNVRGGKGEGGRRKGVAHNYPKGRKSPGTGTRKRA